MGKATGVNNSMIKIEDLLPLFDDLTSINDFKKEINDSLDEYSKSIKSLNSEMEKYNKLFGDVEEKIRNLSTRCIVVTPTSRRSMALESSLNKEKDNFINPSPSTSCELCRSNVMTTEFYAFPCGHKFHSQCLISYIYTFLDHRTQV